MNINKISKQLTLATLVSIGFGPVLASGTAPTHSIEATILSQTKQERYIKTYAPLAVKQMVKYGIPASSILAQGLLESQSGESTLAKEANNHFGIKCKNDWQGRKRIQQTTEIENGFPKNVSACFRAYDNVEASYEDHSVFLLSRSAYAALVEDNNYDIKTWAETFVTANYASDKRYTNKLLSLVDRYDLTQYDQKAMSIIATNGKQVLASNDEYSLSKIQKEAQARLQELKEDYDNCISQSEAQIAARDLEITQLRKALEEAQNREAQLEAQLTTLRNNADPFGIVFTTDDAVNLSTGTSSLYPEKQLDSQNKAYVNNIEMTTALAGQSMEDISLDFNIPVVLLYKYNEMSVGSAIQQGDYIFLEEKSHKNKTISKKSVHQVIVGETMHSIAQQYGVKESNLRKRNKLKSGEEPLANEHIFINAKNPAKPAVNKNKFITPQNNW